MQGPALGLQLHSLCPIHKPTDALTVGGAPQRSVCQSIHQSPGAPWPAHTASKHQIPCGLQP